MTFRVGQKVVCVNADEPDERFIIGTLRPGLELVKGRVYTIAAIGLRHPHDLSQSECVLVDEVWRGIHEPFWASRFRPVVSRPTSIEIFKAMLNPSQVTVDESTIADQLREHVLS